VPCRKESISGHVSVNGVYYFREGKYKREHGGAQVESGGRESMLLFSRYL
jgi:hypothetical protein